MDDIVKQAMAKWPNVPNCFGWLALDARGGWRMRDERAQHLNLPGDKITQAALLGFINRNYGADEQGRWYFQNGPQRVYVTLETTPYVARTDPQQGWLLQTGEAMVVERAWLTEAGDMLLQGAGKLARLDDRDVAGVLGALRLDGKPVDDDGLLAWIGGGAGAMTLGSTPVERIEAARIADTFGFILNPTDR
jgi:hypothetical protein